MNKRKVSFSGHKGLLTYLIALVLLIPSYSVVAADTLDFDTLYKTEHNSATHSAYKIEVEREEIQPATATVILIYKDKDSQEEILDRYTDTVPPGDYGPYSPQIIDGYDYVELDSASAPTDGNISADNTIEIIFLYERQQATPSGYSVTYISNGGSGPGSVDSNLPINSEYTIKNQIDADVGYRSYYFFDNWNTREDGLGVNYIVDRDYTITADLTLYAKWVPRIRDLEVAVKLIHHYDTDMLVEDIALPIGEYALSALFARTVNHQDYKVYEITGTGGNDEAVVFSEGYTYTVNIYYMQDYTVTFMLNDATDGVYATRAVNPMANTVAQTADGMPINPTRSGYVFTGWNRQSDGGGVAFDGATPITSDLTVYAQWEEDQVPPPPTYPVIVNSSYATTSGAGDYASGETVTLNAGTRTDYIFNGWTVTSGGVTLANASNATTTFIMPANAVTVTANWLYDDGDEEPPPTEPPVVNPSEPDKPSTPQTGDNSSVLWWIVLGSSVLGMVCILIWRKLQKTKDTIASGI